MKQPIIAVLKLKEYVSDKNREFIYADLCPKLNKFFGQEVLVIMLDGCQDNGFEIVTARQITQEESDELVKLYKLV